MSSHPSCPFCGLYLNEPYIKCAICSVSICLQCFRKGVENDEHKNDHNYIVMKNNFTLFDSWTAAEELTLLNAISECGAGNWDEISCLVPTKSKTECINHYYHHYVTNAKHPLPMLVNREHENHPAPLMCSSKCQDPPRPSNSAGYNEMAGYMPARGDFASEPDDFLELNISELDFDSDEDDALVTDLKRTTLKVFNNHLKKRHQKKAIMKTYALINSKKNMDEMSRYEVLGQKITSNMKVLMRLIKPHAFDALMEGLLCEVNLRRKIRILQECRSAGITKCQSINTYLKMKKKQELTLHSKTMLDEVLAHMKDEALMYRSDFIQKQLIHDGHEEGMSSITERRPKAPPLQITGLPCFEKLTDRERELCSVLRLYPTAYLQYKSMLINEYRKLGSLRLANARLVVKIDVNKTRKIYDLLLEDGLISKGPTPTV